MELYVNLSTYVFACGAKRKSISEWAHQHVKAASVTWQVNETALIKIFIPGLNTAFACSVLIEVTLTAQSLAALKTT